MSYLPFARKYRPQTFEDLVGQPHVTTTLSRALAQQRVGQAYLFTGQRGVGKTSAARLLAKCLNCERGPGAASCNRCASCTQIAEGRSLDVIEIDGASNRGIDEVRSLRESVGYAPAGGRFRVYIIDEVHMLTAEAFNALLKTLEEPPAHVKFIFATTAAGKIPATILSRCQRFDFRRLEPSTVVPVLQGVAQREQVPITEPALFAIARAAEGSLRDAEVILEQAASFVQGRIDEPDVAALLGTLQSEALLDWTQAILDRDAPKALAVLAAQLDQGRDPTQLLTGLLHHLRSLLILRMTAEAPSRDALRERLIDEPAQRRARLEAQAASADEQEFILFLQLLIGAYELVRRSPMAQTILELAIIKLATRDAWQSLDEISRRLEQVGTGGLPSATLPAPMSAVRTPVPERARAASPAESSVEARPMSAAPAEPLAASPPEMPDVWRGAWPTFLERLGAQKMSLAAYLADAKPLGLEGGVLTIGLPGFVLHQEVLASPDHQRLIERLLGELVQAPVTVRYATLPKPAASEAPASPRPPAGAAAPPIVQDIVSLFNATILDRPSPTG